jgi:hypothetical protein
VVDLDREAVTEYYPVGHDNPHPELDMSMISLKQDLFWLFAGIGDARNFFATLIALRMGVFNSDAHKNSRFHFTLLDLKPAAIAKILIMLHLLNQSEDTEAIACAGYLFASLIMPSFAYSKLQQTITDLVDKGRKGAPFLDWIYVSGSYTPGILRHLLAWGSHLYGKYETRDFREVCLSDSRRQKERVESATGRKLPVLPFCEHDDKLFWDYGIMLPDGSLLNHEMKLANLVRKPKRNRGKSSAVSREALDLIDKTWKPNVTLVDVDWIAILDSNSRLPNQLPDFGFIPPVVAQRLFIPTEARAREWGIKSFMGWFVYFFNDASKAIKELRSRMCVELVPGEMNDFLERLRHDAWSKGNGGDKQGKFDPSTFPRKYNRIHMSNIP